MKGLSKSKYTLFCQCPKALWLRIYKPDAATPDPSVEARFEQGNEVGAVDILRKTKDGWAIYEVKSSSSDDEKEGKMEAFQKYAVDIAYQKWVLTQCGIKVTGTYLVCLNKDYVLDGELDIQELLRIKTGCT